MCASTSRNTVRSGMRMQQAECVSTASFEMPAHTSWSISACFLACRLSSARSFFSALARFASLSCSKLHRPHIIPLSTGRTYAGAAPLFPALPNQAVEQSQSMGSRIACRKRMKRHR